VDGLLQKLVSYYKVINNNLLLQSSELLTEKFVNNNYNKTNEDNIKNLITLIESYYFF